MIAPGSGGFTGLWLPNPQLSGPAQAAIVDPNNIKLISPASYWEIAIKLSIQKYTLYDSYEEFIQEAVFSDHPTLIIHVQCQPAYRQQGLELRPLSMGRRPLLHGGRRPPRYRLD